jgi:hypothetical protein
MVILASRPNQHTPLIISLVFIIVERLFSRRIRQLTDGSTQLINYRIRRLNKRSTMMKTKKMIRVCWFEFERESRMTIGFRLLQMM